MRPIPGDDAIATPAREGADSRAPPGEAIGNGARDADHSRRSAARPPGAGCVGIGGDALFSDRRDDSLDHRGGAAGQVVRKPLSHRLTCPAIPSLLFAK
jgi:hypothetical protein